MPHPGAELQKTLFDALSGSVELQNLIGANKVFDDVPAQVKPPYITFGKANHFDWSTGSEAGMEHEIQLEVWSRQAGRKQIYEIQQLILDAASSVVCGPMQEHNLINLTHEESTTQALPSLQIFKGTCLFRAVSEPDE